MISGIPYARIVTIAHVLSSVLAVLSGFLLVGLVGAGSLDIGRDLPLSSLVAVILGGVTFGSGKGGSLGPAVAAFMLTFSFNLLTSLGIGEPGKLMLQGAIIALAATRRNPELVKMERRMPHVMQEAEPFFFNGNDIAVLVLHGFTGTTQSVRYLGQELHRRYGLRSVVPAWLDTARHQMTWQRPAFTIGSLRAKRRSMN
ncbi:Branched-chain amino acid transport system / permease component [Bradyrhizobium sp. Gha]|nr:Branched-chain amino acid transport system / permease component [Bradyrhizobium sp. Gha]